MKITMVTRNLSLLGLTAFLTGGLSTAFAATKGVAQTATDPQYLPPIPPNNLFPQNPEHVFVSTMIMLAIALFFMIVAARDSWKYRSTVPIGMVLGAAACVVPEAVDNYLGGVYWSQSHQLRDIMFILMGREFDWYVAIMWWAFGAILGYLLYAALLRHISTLKLWGCLLLSAISDIVVEELLLGYGGIYTYYGNQPLVLFRHFPCWWMFVNVAALFLSASLAYRFRDWFNGWRSLLILFLMPFCYIGAFSFCGMPAIFAINGMFSPAVTQLLGIISCLVAVIHSGAVMNIILGRNPFPFGQKITTSIGVENSSRTAIGHRV